MFSVTFYRLPSFPLVFLQKSNLSSREKQEHRRFHLEKCKKIVYFTKRTCSQIADLTKRQNHTFHKVKEQIQEKLTSHPSSHPPHPEPLIIYIFIKFPPDLGRWEAKGFVACLASRNAAICCIWPLELGPEPQMARNGCSSPPRSRRIREKCCSSLP